MIVLRPYQEAAVGCVESAFSLFRTCIVVMPTGTGKTTLMAGIVARLTKNRVMLIAHREELVRSAAAEIETMTGEQVGVEMGMDKTFTPGELYGCKPPRIVVASVQTLFQDTRLAKFDPAEFELLLVDECFPAGTLVDGKPIESVVAGDWVMSKSADGIAPRQVLRVMKRKPRKLVTVHLSNGASLTCTPEHPIWDDALDLYVPAIRLNSQSVVLTLKDYENAERKSGRSTSRSGMQLVQADFPGNGMEEEDGKEGGLLLDRMRPKSILQVVFKANGENERRSCIGEDDSQQPNAGSNHPGEGVYVPPCDGMEAASQNGERNGANGLRAANGECAGMADELRRTDSDEKGERLSIGLQNRCGELTPENRRGDRRQQSLRVRAQEARQEEDGIFERVGVDHIEVHEQTDCGRFGGLCPDGHVYNLEVAGEHNYFADGILVHNCHHDIPQNMQYLKVRRHFRQNKELRLLGVTATPDRADELALEQSYEHVAYDYQLPKAIEDGWLCPIKQKYITIEGLDFSKVRSQFGDMSDRDLEKILADEPQVVHEVASSIVDIAGDRKTLIFAVTVKHAQLIAEVIRRYPGKRAEVLHGGTDRDTRREKLAEYAAGGFQFLVGCAIFTEGFNEPSIQVVAVARPTKSRALYTQMVGRGTRTLRGCLRSDMTLEERVAAIAASEKQYCEVVDFVGNSGKHSLVSTADILAGEVAPEAVQRAVAAAKKSPGPIDMKGAVEQAQKEIEFEEIAAKIRRELEEQARLAAEERKRAVRAEAKYHSREVDAFHRADVDRQDAGYDRRGEPATEKQVEYLRSRGVHNDGMTKAEAGKAISDLKERSAKGLCSPKQEATLRRSGEQGEISQGKARVLFAVLQARGWKARDYPLTPRRFEMRPNQDGTFSPVVVDPAVGRILIADVKFRNIAATRAFIEGVLENHAERVA